MRYFGWLQGEEMGCLFLPLYNLVRNWLAICVLLCAAFLILVFDTIIFDVPIAITRHSWRKNNRRRGRRKECVMCGFCTEFQSSCKIYAISSTILFPVILNVSCTGYSCVVYFYVKKDYSFSIIYLWIYVLLTKIFSFYSSFWTQIFMWKCGRYWPVYCGSKEYLKQHL